MSRRADYEPGISGFQDQSDGSLHMILGGKTVKQTNETEWNIETVEWSEGDANGKEDRVCHGGGEHILIRRTKQAQRPWGENGLWLFQKQESW